MLELRALSQASRILQTEYRVAFQLHRSHSKECNQQRSQDNKDDFSMKEQLVTAQTELIKL